MPTLFEMVGVKAPASFVGRSLLPLMTGAAGEDLESFCESTLYGADKIALRTGRYKFIHDLNPLAAQREELYDLHVDPAELNNLVGSRAGLAAELRQRLMKLHTELADEAASMSTPEPVDMSPRHIEQLRSLGYLGR